MFVVLIDETFTTLTGFEKVADAWTVGDLCIQESAPRAHHSRIKSLDRFFDAMLPCPTVVLSGKDECKIFQHHVFLLW